MVYNKTIREAAMIDFTAYKGAFSLTLKALPYVLCLGIGAWLVYDNMSTKNELSNAQWEIATLTNRAESAEYNLAQEKKWQEERKAWNAELDADIQKFKKSLAGYTQQLKAIQDERTKTGTNNSLSEPVTRVLKEFNSKG